MLCPLITNMLIVVHTMTMAEAMRNKADALHASEPKGQQTNPRKVGQDCPIVLPKLVANKINKPHFYLLI